MDSTPPPLQKKGLGPLAWIGIGCGGIVVLAIVALLVVTFVFGGKITQFAKDAQANPTRATAATMVKMSMGEFVMVAEDDVNKRYTVEEKKTGKLTTIFWNEKKKAPDTIPGDFTSIPAENQPGAAPAAATPAPAP